MGTLQPLLPFDCDRSGWRQLLNLCGPFDGKPSVADLEDDPLADYIVEVRAASETRGCALPRAVFHSSLRYPRLVS